MAVLTGVVKQPFKIVDKLGAVLQQGVIGNDGRMPRIDMPTADSLVLQIGEDKWEPFSNAPAAAPPAGREEDEQLISAEIAGTDPFQVRDDEDIIHLSKEIIALYASATHGDEE